MRPRLPDYWNGWWTLTMISAAFTIAVVALVALVALERLGVFRAGEIALMNTVSTEHGALRVLLILGLAITVIGMSYISFLVYRVHRMSERAEALTAATYLEAKRALEQHR
jgi:hypothetical protein